MHPGWSPGLANHPHRPSQHSPAQSKHWPAAFGAATLKCYRNLKTKAHTGNSGKNSKPISGHYRAVRGKWKTVSRRTSFWERKPGRQRTQVGNRTKTHRGHCGSRETIPGCVPLHRPLWESQSGPASPRFPSHPSTERGL